MKMMKKIGVSLLTLCLALSAFLTTDVFNAVEAKTENGHNSGNSGNHVVENQNKIPSSIVPVTTKITVKELVVDVTSVTMNQETAEVIVGQNLELQASVLPENATDKALKWTSSNKAVATVKDGIVTTITAGTTTITATSSNGMSASCTITVKARDVLKRIDRSNWQIAVFSTESVGTVEEHGDNSQPFNRTATGNSEGPAERMIDGNYETHWHDEYDDVSALDGKYSIIVQLNDVKEIAGFELLRRHNGGNGQLASYTVYTLNDSSLVFSNENKSWSDKSWQKVGEGQFTGGTTAAKFESASQATHVRIDVVGTGNWGTASELNFYEFDGRAPLSLDNMEFEGTAYNEGSTDIKAALSDGNPYTYWTSHVNGQNIDGNTSLTIDLGEYYDITGIDYTKRYHNDDGNKWNCTGNLLNYKIEVSFDGQTWSEAKSGQTNKVTYQKINNKYYSFLKSGNDASGYMVEGTTNIEFLSECVKFIRITATKSFHWKDANLDKYFTIADLNIYGTKSKGYNIVAVDVNPNIVANTTLRYTDGTLMTGTSGNRTPLTMYNEDRDTENYFDFGEDYKSGYIEIDLGGYYDVNSINALFYHDNARRYKDVVVLVSDNRKFSVEDIVYNNDSSNKHGFGQATTIDDSKETSAGRTIEFETRKARFIRIYMAGNTTGGGNQVVELEVYGVPSTTPNFIITTEQVTNIAKEWLYESSSDGVDTYVSPDVLRVKAQSELVTDENGQQKANVRFVSSVASENLEKVRFKVEVINESQIRTNQVTTTKVYEQIAVNNGEKVYFENPTDVFDNSASKYFFIAKLNNIPTSARNQLVRVTPCWLPLGYEDTDANYVEGVSRTFVISEFFDYATQTLNVNE